MKLTRFFVSVVLSASSSAAAARAQTAGVPAPAPAQAEQEEARARRAELETKAFALLEEVAAEAGSLRLQENRARLQAAAAAALWPRDEKRAREIFQSAIAGLSSLSSSPAADDPRSNQQYHNLQSLRREIAFAVAQREPKLALEFVRGTRPPPPLVGGPGSQPDQELALEAQLAELVAARDPREAVRLAEESLARGVSGNLPGVLERVRHGDAQAASKLAAEVVRKLRSSNLAANFEAANVANYLLQATRPPAAAAAPQQSTGPVGITAQNIAALPISADARALTLDEATRRELIALVVNAALGGAGERGGRREAGTHLLHALRAVMPEVERLMPEQAPALRRRMSAAEGAGGQPTTRARWQEYEQLMRTGTADAITQAAQRAPEEMRWPLYQRAAQKALEEGSAERARQIISDSATEPRQREQLLRELDQQLFWRAANQGDAQQALALLARFKAPEERTGMMLALAQAAASRGNRELAERLLEEVLGQTGVRARNAAQFSAQLQAAHAYAQFAPERAFQIAESGVEHLNELVAAAVLVDGFGQEAFDQGELKLDGSVWAGLVQQSGGLLGALAAKDFERARDVAGRFQRAEARTHALLAVARGILGGGDAARGRRRDPRRAAAPVLLVP
jgi:hypothetical protein